LDDEQREPEERAHRQQGRKPRVQCGYVEERDDRQHRERTGESALDPDAVGQHSARVLAADTEHQQSGVEIPRGFDVSAAHGHRVEQGLVRQHLGQERQDAAVVEPGEHHDAEHEDERARKQGPRIADELRERGDAAVGAGVAAVADRLLDARGLVELDGEREQERERGRNRQQDDDDAPVEEQQEERGRERSERDAQIPRHAVVGERRSLSGDALADERQSRGVVDARGDAPADERHGEYRHVRRETEEDERPAHPRETGEYEFPRAVGVGQQSAGERAETEQRVPRRDDQPQRARRHAEPVEPDGHEYRHRELVGVNHRVGDHH